MSDSEKAAEIEGKSTLTFAEFARAYGAWRDQLCEEAFNGLPIADPEPDRLFRAVVSQLKP